MALLLPFQAMFMFKENSNQTAHHPGHIQWITASASAARDGILPRPKKVKKTHKKDLQPKSFYSFHSSIHWSRFAPRLVFRSASSSLFSSLTTTTTNEFVICLRCWSSALGLEVPRLGGASRSYGRNFRRGLGMAPHYHQTVLGDKANSNYTTLELFRVELVAALVIFLARKKKLLNFNVAVWLHW